MGIPGSANPMLFGGAGAYQINQSLRFDGSAYLNRTPASAGNRKTWTWSGWFKIGIHSSSGTYNLFGTRGTNDGTYFVIQIRNQALYVNTYQAAYLALYSTQVFRDPSAWYHVVVALDMTQATSSNRVKVYVNGAQITQFSTANYGVQNNDLGIGDAREHLVGAEAAFSSSPAYFWDGYLAEVNFIDGTALTPSSFGETDTITGAWIPKKYSGSYGTNGFYLKYESSGIGTDSSGNGNNWTANNFSTSGTGTDVMSDTPTNNWCTLNPLWAVSTNYSTFSDGNLTSSIPNGYTVGSTLELLGKKYFEYTFTSGSGGNGVGVIASNATNRDNRSLFYAPSNAVYLNGSTVGSTSGSWATNDVIGVAVDMDAKTVSFYRNGSLQFGQSFSISTITDGSPFLAAAASGGGSTQVGTMNFGQRAFAYTPPSGFLPLNTANLPEPTIKKGSKYFDTVLYTGNGTARSITGLGFSPDFVWIKERSSTGYHALFDVLRGATVGLSSNISDADYVDTNSLTSFDANGFSVGTGGGAWYVNRSSQTYVAWAWDANGAGSSNTAGTITSTVSANATAGFSIVKWTGTGADGSVGHGLGVAPKMLIVKDTSNAYNWYVFTTATGSNLRFEGLNTTAAATSQPSQFTASSTVISNLTSAASLNTSGATMLMYCFSEVAGYSKFGSYTGNGSSDGPFVYCGFRPRWVLTKRTDTTSVWMLYDTARLGYNQSNNYLQPNTNIAEGSGDNFIDILSNGFKVRVGSQSINVSGGTYIFAAFAEHPFKYANAR